MITNNYLKFVGKTSADKTYIVAQDADMANLPIMLNVNVKAVILSANSLKKSII